MMTNVKRALTDKSRVSSIPRSILMLLVVIVVWQLFVGPVLAGQTLDRVRTAKVVRCGISDEVPGFAFKDTAGQWQGFTADFCRAVAAAALGDAEKTTFTPLTASARFPALVSGRIDLLAHTATMTFGREAGIGVEFAGIYFFDGQSFMVPSKKQPAKIKDLSRRTICVQKGTTHEKNLENWARAQSLTYTPLLLDSISAMNDAFFAGRCQVYTADRSQLAAVRSIASGGPDRFEILSTTVSKEPLGPVVRRGDEEWLTLVRWVLFALIEAEERGITRADVRKLQKSSVDPSVQWFLNASGQQGKSLGIREDWVANVIAAVGNYGEIYDRYFGKQGPVKMERGWNRLWNRGGLLYSPPFQ